MNYKIRKPHKGWSYCGIPVNTRAAHIRMDESGKWWIEEIIAGDTVREVLAYIQYDSSMLTRAIRGECERSVHLGKMTACESREMVQAYENGLSGYTYLEGEAD